MAAAEVTKAIVLCAGEGTRLRPLTFSKPKHLLPVAGKPLLGHVLENLAQAGLCDVGLVVGHHPEAVQRYVGDGEQWGVNTTYIVQQQPLGLGHAVKQAQDFLDDAPFVVYLGDNLLEKGITSFVGDFRAAGPAAALLLKEVSDPRRYGVAVIDAEHRVLRVVEKPAVPPSPLAIVGVYAFQPIIFEAIERTTASPRGEVEITDAIQYLVDQGHVVHADLVEGFWEDAGEPDTLLVANRRYLDALVPCLQGTVRADCQIDGNACVGRGTRLTNSQLLGPCLIGRNCVIDNAVIGPYAAIGDGCNITGSRIADSVVQQNCRIAQVVLERSVLGEEVQISGREPLGNPLHMILGDMAQIRMF